MKTLLQDSMRTFPSGPMECLGLAIDDTLKVFEY